MEIRKTIDQANSLRKNGDHASAESLYDQVLIFDPENAEVLYCKGLNCWQSDPIRAIKFFKESVLIDSKLMGAFNNISNAANEQGHHNEALLAFDELKKVYPTNLELIYNRAVTVGNLGHHLDALLDFYFVVDFVKFSEDQFLKHQISTDIAYCKTEIRNITRHERLENVVYDSKIPPKEYHYPLPAKQFGDENYLLEFGKFMGRNLKEIVDQQPDYIYWCIENLDNFCVGEDVLKLMERKGISSKSAQSLNRRKLQVLENSKPRLTMDGPLPDTIRMDKDGNIIL